MAADKLTQFAQAVRLWNADRHKHPLPESLIEHIAAEIEAGRIVATRPRGRPKGTNHAASHARNIEIAIQAFPKIIAWNSMKANSEPVGTSMWQAIAREIGLVHGSKPAELRKAAQRLAEIYADNQDAALEFYKKRLRED